MKKALSVAGSDTSGGAGIQADLKTFQSFGVYGMTALTVMVAMDPHDGWSHQVFPVDLDIIKAQLETIVAGIGFDAMKTGMLPTPEIIGLVAEMIKKHKPKNIVVDPVMVCKGAGEPVSPGNTKCFIDTLIPLATVVTPNLYEASQLSGIKIIETAEDMKTAARIIREFGVEYVVIKGGKGITNSADLLYDGTTFEYLETEKIVTDNTHGAGCTFSAAITAGLAKGSSPREAIINAKDFITNAIRNSFVLNRFVGTIDHSGAGKV